MATGAMPVRYDVRRDRHGWTIYDLRSGQTAILDDVLQVGLDRDTADHLAEALSAPQSVPISGRPLADARISPGDRWSF
ncbi:MAG: hypothetical protein PGN34_05505 [Methylobacterium frigidaeris]